MDKIKGEPYVEEGGYSTPEMNGQTKGLETPGEDIATANSQQNEQQVGKKLSSRYRGVCWNKKNKRWQAAINSAGKYLYLGSYVSEMEAACAFDRAAIRIRGRKARINFKFEDYKEQLEEHEQQKTPKLSTQLGGGKDNDYRDSIERLKVGPTVTTNAAMRGVPVFGAQPDGQAHSQFSYRGIPHVGGDIGLHQDQVPSMDTLQGGHGEPTDIVLGDGQNPKALWGRVIATAGHEDMRQDAPMELYPQSSSLHTQTVDTQNTHQLVGLANFQQLEDQTQVLFVPQNHEDTNVHVSPSQHTSPSVQSTFTIQPPAKPALNAHDVKDPMSTIPSDCQIIKLIPNQCGVFAVMYARPGSLSTGALIWDGCAVHNMGMFSSRNDAHLACVGASAIVVKLLQQYGAGGNQPVPVMQNPVILAGGGEATADRVHVPQQAEFQENVVRDVQIQDQHAGRHDQVERVEVERVPSTDNPERQAPQASPFSSSGSLLRWFSGMNSADLGKFLPQGVSIQEIGKSEQTTAVAQLVRENKGNLGSLMHNDSWSSSILGLISSAAEVGGQFAGNGNKEAGPASSSPPVSREGDADKTSGQVVGFGTAGLPVLHADFGQLQLSSGQLGALLQDSGNLSLLLPESARPIPLDGEALPVSKAQQIESHNHKDSNDQQRISSPHLKDPLDCKDSSLTSLSLLRCGASSDYAEVVNCLFSKQSTDDCQTTSAPHALKQEDEGICKIENGDVRTETQCLKRKAQSTERDGDRGEIVGSGKRVKTPEPAGDESWKGRGWFK